MQTLIRSHSRTWMIRTLALLIAAGCAALTPVGHAQTPQNEYSAQTQADPPARVGRISMLSGPVSLTDLNRGDVESATLNWPITSAVRLSTGTTGRAEVRIGSVAIRLDDNTRVDFNRVDDDSIQLFVHQGSVALRIRSREVMREIDLLTPRERITFDNVGRYRIDVDRTPGLSAVTAFTGHARMTRGDMSFPVQNGYRGELTESSNASLFLVAPLADAFDDWVAERDVRDDASHSAQYLSRETTGMESLDDYGTWMQTREYGAVWYPTHVVTGWAPYRHGHWVWMSPWGWTWIDEAPWGFAPFHYGRWVIVNGRWCWAPGRWAARPYYAPALVAWVSQPGVSIHIHAGYPVGWFPLGWGEVYYPSHHYSPRYIRSVNVQNVNHITQVTVINPPRQYVHQQHPDSVSWAPANALPQRQRIQDVMSGRAPEELIRATPVARSPLVQPSTEQARAVQPPKVRNPGSFKHIAPTPGSSPHDDHRTRTPERTPRSQRDEQPSPQQQSGWVKQPSRQVERVQIERLPQQNAAPQQQGAPEREREPVQAPRGKRTMPNMVQPQPQQEDARPGQSERGKSGGR